MSTNQSYWAVIPAAGAGTRMGSDIPKQYLKLRDKYILEHTLQIFCRHEKIQGIVVVLAENDPYWGSLEIADNAKILTTVGGVERCHSVQNGLRQLAKTAGADDWVMVHDAARPCLRSADIDKLIDTLSSGADGGILATPVKDTIKRAGPANQIAETVDRHGLWHALTPQMFRLSKLVSALDEAISKKLLVTDEAQAMELSGEAPVIIQGHPDNIKITNPHDLPLAELFLSLQEREK